MGEADESRKTSTGEAGQAKDLQTPPTDQEIEEYVDASWDGVMDDLASLVAIRSVEDTDAAMPNAPWGPECAHALERACAIAERLGLDTANHEGYIGTADVSGADGSQVAIIAHSDVVAEGEGWHTDPFKMERRDGYLLGRGVLDDKEGVVLALWTAGFFAKRAGTLRHPLRVLIGTNEETRMGDVDYYLKHFDQPAFLFTPDSEFPATNGEKGQMTMTVTSAPLGAGTCIAELRAGSASNAIPGTASALVRADAEALQPTDAVDVTPEGQGMARVTAHGKGGHAAMPEGTVNAIGVLCDYLLSHDLCNKGEEEFLRFEAQAQKATDGSQFDIARDDEAFGPVTCVGGMLMTDGQRMSATIDVRFVRGMSVAFVQTQVERVAKRFGASVAVDRSMPPFYVDADKPEVQALVDAYNAYSGKDERGEAFTIGGGTYARHFKNAVGFGPEEPDELTPDWVGTMHGPDEGVSEAELKRDFKIYLRAVSNLMQVEL